MTDAVKSTLAPTNYPLVFEHYRRRQVLSDGPEWKIGARDVIQDLILAAAVSKSFDAPRIVHDPIVRLSRAIAHDL